jgi:hypothetical protein
MYNAARQFFGSWRWALQAAGIDLANLRPASRRLEKHEILDRLRQMHAAGHSMKWTAVCLENRAFAMSVKNAFGSWREGLIVAGLLSDGDVVVGRRRWNPERVIAAIRKRASEGQAITSADVRVEDSPLHAAARRYFGSWRDALVAARVEGDGRGGKGMGK